MRKPEFHEGDPLSASMLNQLVEWCSAGRLRFGRGIKTTGDRIALAERPGWWAKLTSRGAGANYAWTRQIATASGGWSDDTTLSGTTSSDPAYEVNGNTTLTLPTRAWAWRDHETSEVRFSMSVCDSGSSGASSPEGDTITLGFPP
jgi:hypothetical protein